MKICDIAQAYTESSGGIRTYIQAKRRHILSRTPYQHILIVPGDEDDVIREKNATTYTVKGFAFPGGHPYRFITRLDKVYSILREEKPQVMELGTPYILPWAAFHCRRRHGGIITGYYHADFPSTYVHPHVEPRVGRRMGRQLKRTASGYSRMVYSRCDATIVASRNFHRKLRALGLDNTRYIPLGVDPQLFHPLRRERSTWLRHGLKETDKIMVYVGRLDEEKSVMDLVRALRLVEDPEVKLVLIGDGPLRESLLHEASGDPRLKVLPYMANRIELARILASADVYVTAGAHETFGLSVVEAQACGLAVIGVSAGALRERVTEGLGYLARAGSPDSLAICMKRCLANDYRQMGALARRTVTRLFNWDTTMENTMELYRDLVGHSLDHPAPRFRNSLTTGLTQP